MQGVLREIVWMECACENAKEAVMQLVAKFDALAEYLEQRNYYEDEALRDLAESLGREVDEAEQYMDDQDEHLEQLSNRVHRGYGGSFV